jgi:hypothetical protein
LSESLNCRACGRPLFLLDKEKGRWYCYEDDQVYLEKEQKWLGTLPIEGKLRRNRISSETSTAVLIGLFVGFLHAMILTLENSVILFPLLTQQQFGVTSELFDWSITVAEEAGNTLVVGIIGGCVLGYLFATLKTRIPGSTTIRKAVVFSLILTLIEVLLRVSPIFDSALLLSSYGNSYTLMIAATSVNLIVLNPILGFLFGYMLDRTPKPKKTNGKVCSFEAGTT